jgi:GntR family transcriptional regulator / MocR family aminotransferase
MIDIRGDHVLEEAIAVLFRNGDMQRHLKKSVKLYHERRDLLCALLKKELNEVVVFQKPAGGLALWVRFHKKFQLPAIAAKVSARGLLMSDGRNYSYGAPNDNAMRMGFAGFTEREMKEVVEIIKSVAQ